ncbi:uncharacterized protein LOC111353586 isoform X1 [Spodoptera litura]|uniref:Uncharacterized protein LOC111353586 isoform X1 n=1 Tax=Spodoptera litura TaxID=69820 RepID=A0A9J7IQP4_SPOLT|nr:uncharacterized protein LOC111353586 isoform X1 [Spodoptera litura]
MELNQKDLLPQVQPVPSTSQQSRTSILMELNQKDILPEAVPSTSKQLSQISVELSQEEIHTLSTVENLPEKMPNLTIREKQLMERLKKTKCSLTALRRSANLLGKLESGVLKEIVL